MTSFLLRVLLDVCKVSWTCHASQSLVFPVIYIEVEKCINSLDAAAAAAALTGTHKQREQHPLWKADQVKKA